MRQDGREVTFEQERDFSLEEIRQAACSSLKLQEDSTRFVLARTDGLPIRRREAQVKERATDDRVVAWDGPVEIRASQMLTGGEVILALGNREHEHLAQLAHGRALYQLARDNAGCQEFKAGVCVELHSLQSSQHNGARGTLMSFDAQRQRWGVKMIGSGQSSLKVKPENMACCSAKNVLKKQRKSLRAALLSHLGRALGDAAQLVQAEALRHIHEEMLAQGGQGHGSPLEEWAEPLVASGLLSQVTQREGERGGESRGKEGRVAAGRWGAGRETCRRSCACSGAQPSTLLRQKKP